VVLDKLQHRIPKFQHTLGIDFNWTIPINELSQGLKRKKAVASATAIVAVATLALA